MAIKQKYSITPGWARVWTFTFFFFSLSILHILPSLKGWHLQISVPLHRREATRQSAANIQDCPRFPEWCACRMGPVWKFVPRLTSFVDTANKFTRASPQNCVSKRRLLEQTIWLSHFCLVCRNARTSHGSEIPDRKYSLCAFSTTGSTVHCPESQQPRRTPSIPGVNHFVLRRRDRVASAVLNAVWGSYSSLDKASQNRWHRV